MRPVFRSKAQREALAKQRDEQEQKSAAETNAARAQEAHALIAARRQAEEAARAAYEEEQRRAREREAQEKRQDEEQERLQAEALRKRKCPPGKYTKAERREFYSRGTQTAEEIVRERRLERYLGKKKDARRYASSADVEKARKLMEWDARDDTTIADTIVDAARDEDLAAAARVPFVPLCGRGNLGGVDAEAAAAEAEEEAVSGIRGDKKQVTWYKALASTLGPGSGGSKNERVARAVRTAIGRYHKHWSLKTRDEMSARDWRIFKEDFGISTRGSSIPNPMRAWDESGVAEPVLRAIREQGWERPAPSTPRCCAK